MIDAIVTPFFSRTRAFIRQGNAARDSGDWLGAMNAYGAALQRRPGLAHIWVQYGHALKERGSVTAALDAYRRAATLNADIADTHHQIGRMLVLLGDHAAALESYERALALDPDIVDAGHEARMLRQRLRRRARRDLDDVPERLRFVNLGTTGTCNASCIHCPTGKAVTAHVPRSTMAMALFQKIIDGIADLDLAVTDQVAFGLFGDGLVDPLVVQRAAYLRAKLPDVRLSVNTNGAAFNREKHVPLRDYTSTIALHCESLVPETYDYLMQPLRAKNVFPKYTQILDAFPGQVVVSVPVSKRNIGELPAIRTWFTERGAKQVVFDPLSSRCAEDRSLFNTLALNPKPIRCLPEIVEDLIVDCDGHVLICCQDFARTEGIGNLQTHGLRDVLANVQRLNTRILLAENRHPELTTCRNCFADIRGENVTPQTPG